MSVIDAERMGFFSNPKVDHFNDATGNSTRNNARKLREEACRVAEYRSPPPPPPAVGTEMSLYISGPQWICPGETVQLKGTLVTNYPAPFTFIWSTSLDYGQSWQVAKTVLSTTATTDFLTVYPPMPVGAQVFIRLEAGTVSGVHKIANHSVQTLDPSEPHSTCPHSSDPNPNPDSLEPNVFRVSPNPISSGYLEVTFDLPEVQNLASLELLSNDGRLIKTLIQSGPRERSGSAYLKIPDYLPSGIYQLRLKLDKSVMVRRIAVVR